MGIFGRVAARRRLRSAARQSLGIPAFSMRVDATPWVIGGLWPAELSMENAETATLAEYLRTDLQRIVDSANEKLKLLRWADVVDAVGLAEEERILSVARAFAVLRVESTVRLLRDEAPEFRTEYLSLNPADSVDKARHDGSSTSAGLPTETPPEDSPEVSQAGIKRGRHAAPEVDWNDAVSAPEPDVIEPGSTGRTAPANPFVIDFPAADQDTAHDQSPVQQQSYRVRLQHLVEFLARQEPGLRWAVGDRADGTTVVVTDIAHGWIPPGIDLPAGVALLPPARREGAAIAMLGESTESATYAPGDPFSGATEFDVTVPSTQPRELPGVDDLGWELGEATHWREGLPRMVHTLAKAGTAGTGVVEAEIDVLLVHLDTARYQLLAQYPDIDMAKLLNCQLMAATAGIATGDRVSANYHAAWFRLLSEPQASKWKADT